MTSKHRLIFRPLEKLQIQNIGSVSIEEVPIDYKLEKEFKPGLYSQVRAFISNKKNIMTIDEQVKSLEYYNKILGK